MNNLSAAKISVCILVVAITLGCSTGNHHLHHQQQQEQQTVSVPDECSELQSPISQVVNTLSYRLVSAIGGEENLFVSPFCISVALGMVYLGARGSTAREMEEALGYTSLRGNATTSTAVHEAIHDELVSLENHTEEYSLLVANAIFKQTGYDVLPEYTRQLKSMYSALVHDANFAGDGEAVVKNINEWVSHHTQGKINSLFEEPLDPLTRMVLLNAIYFKGFWKYPFDEARTRLKTFYKLDGTIRDASFMQFQRKAKYFEDSETGYSFLELDYKGDHISTLFMLPDDEQEFPKLEVTNDMLCRIRSKLATERVLAYIPKFHMEYERELSEDMKALGVNELFGSGNTDLTGMRIQNDLYASLMKHKAVIDVHEQGTEAAAVSGVVLTARSGLARLTPVFKANHPFLFCILDKRSGTILFIGRVLDP